PTGARRAHWHVRYQGRRLRHDAIKFGNASRRSLRYRYLCQVTARSPRTGRIAQGWVGEPMTGPPQGKLAEVKFQTVAEVAALMRVSKMTVYRLVHTGELTAVRVGRSFRVPEHAVHEYLRDAFAESA